MLDMGFEPQIRKVVDQIRVSGSGLSLVMLLMHELFNNSLTDRR